MSLEAKIDLLVTAINALTAALERKTVPATTVTAQVASAPPAAPVPPTVAVTPPVPEVAPKVAAPIAPVAESRSSTPAMPAPPSFTAPPPAVNAHPAGVPFSDPKGLIDYVMTTYKALGPQKGAQIQNVLTGLGYQNINDVKPEHYGDLFAGIEALKKA